MISAYFLLLSGLTKPPKPTEPLFEGLGNYHRKITTRAKMAARYFDQGLNFVYGFNMDEAIRSFEQATRLDPKCAMAHWGIALRAAQTSTTQKSLTRTLRRLSPPSASLSG